MVLSLWGACRRRVQNYRYREHKETHMDFSTLAFFFRAAVSVVFLREKLLASPAVFLYFHVFVIAKT
jgi:hypothetical protein